MGWPGRPRLFLRQEFAKLPPAPARSPFVAGQRRQVGWKGRDLFLTIAVACLVLAIVVPVAGMVLLGRFLFGSTDAERDDRVSEPQDIAPERLGGRLVWRHLQSWFKAKPRRLPRR
jgi:hypothetical protein